MSINTVTATYTQDQQVSMQFYIKPGSKLWKISVPFETQQFVWKSIYHLPTRTLQDTTNEVRRVMGTASPLTKYFTEAIVMDIAHTVNEHRNESIKRCEAGHPRHPRNQYWAMVTGLPAREQAPSTNPHGGFVLTLLPHNPHNDLCQTNQGRGLFAHHPLPTCCHGYSTELLHPYPVSAPSTSKLPGPPPGYEGF